METKKNLNNTQRKMLDEIYTEQFKKISDGIIEKLKQEENGLKEKIRNDEYKNKLISDFILSNKETKKKYLKMSVYLKENGMSINNIYLDREYQCEHNIVLSTYGNVHPRLRKFRDKREKMEIELAQKKKEIRGRIYGMSLSYDEIDSEISKYLKNLL